MTLIFPLFFLVALLYSLVGFGGGSSYIALLTLFDIPYETIPKIALMCNIIVVTSGALHFYRKGFLKWQLIWPFVVSSVPFAFIGGLIPVSKQLFYLLLGTSLVIAGSQLLFNKSFNSLGVVKALNKPMAVVIGAVLGLLSGMVGIGGGIFLAPILLNLKWATPKQVAATASFFIFINSLFGILGQVTKSGNFIDLYSYAPLFVAVFIGGQIGSYLASGKKISHQAILTSTSVLVFFVGLRLLYKFLF
ncbi:MAG: sulfite exporter TauE/SafE family protein [Bdellovibrionaceae bacterium]|jgi:uncharacterized protein|nr:sulfite exporter TauE/SafE family protein [Pseudobdellovibrionaceae bacterium]